MAESSVLCQTGAAKCIAFLSGDAGFYPLAPASWPAEQLDWIAAICVGLLLLGVLYLLFRQTISVAAQGRGDRSAGLTAGPMAPSTAAARLGLHVARALGIAALSLGVVVLFGWAFHIGTLKSVLPAMVAMQPWTATGIALAGACLVATAESGRSRVRASIVLAALVMTIGSQALLQHVTGLNLGTDGWLFPDALPLQTAPYQFPGRPSPGTGLALVLFGTTVLLSLREEDWARAAYSAVGTLGLLWSGVAVVGYMIDVESLKSVAVFHDFALHTAIALTALFLGTLSLRPNVGWVAMLSGDRPGAALTRTLLPVVVLGPIFLALLFEAGRRAGLYGTEFRLALITLATIALLTTSLLWSAVRLNRAHDARLAAINQALLSEARLRTLTEAIPQLLWTSGPSGLRNYLSPQWYEFSGTSAREQLGNGWLVSIHPDDRSRLRDAWQQAVETREIFHIEARVRRRDGEHRWFKHRAVPLIGSDGEVDQWFGTATDIHELVEAREALFREKERAEVTLQSIGDAVIVTDARGAITYLNPVAERLTGYSLEEAKDASLQTVFNIVNEETRAPAENPVHRCLREDRVVGLANHTILISKDDTEYAIADSAAPIRDRAGHIVGVILVFHDVSETRRLAQQLQYDAAHDELTGLVNRREFERRLERAVSSARQHGHQHALCYLDLDQFKLVNDTAGHIAGDALLKQVRGLLAGRFRDRDTLARLGGDEFALLLDNCGLAKACQIAETLVAAFREWRFTWKGQHFQIGASVGVVAISRTSDCAAQVLAQADVACYAAKEQGRNRVHVYQGEGISPSPHHERMLLAATLMNAGRDNRFRLFSQPIVSLTDSAHLPWHHEVLLRLLGDNGQFIMPDIVIPTAERYGMMADIDRWVIDRALAAQAAANGTRAGLSINLSGASLNTDDLGEYVMDAFTRHNVSPERICFEVTETAAVNNLDQAVKFIQRVRRWGCSIALDDFGIGMSSFHYLRKLPIDYLKIDGSFVRNICSSDHDEIIVAAINEVGHKLGIRTIAEYVHDQPTVERAQALNIDFGQGYAFGAPAPLAEPLLS
jgi:PAS domain S-box/diguanylate cyclase (GGDEF) domain